MTDSPIPGQQQLVDVLGRAIPGVDEIERTAAGYITVEGVVLTGPAAVQRLVSDRLSITCRDLLPVIEQVEAIIQAAEGATSEQVGTAEPATFSNHTEFEYFSYNQCQGRGDSTAECIRDDGDDCPVLLALFTEGEHPSVREIDGLPICSEYTPRRTP